MIFLASVNPDGSERHMKWVGDATLVEANSELTHMRQMAMQYGDKPLDAYIYESNQVAPGFVAEDLDVSQLLSFVNNEAAASMYMGGRRLARTMRSVL
jgi:hypothetical protein